MKSRLIIFVAIALMFAGCKKKPGPGGKNIISGTVYFMNGISGTKEVATDAQVSIAYGSNQSTTEFDKTILTNKDGAYDFEGLRKGDYYLSATFTDAHGFVYKTNGAIVEFKHNKKEARVELILE